MRNNQEIILNSRHGWLGWWPRTGIKSIFDPEKARVSLKNIERLENAINDSIQFCENGISLIENNES